ncbi:MAG: amino acid permease [Actinobacteria bacterium HGW-Actinobacteria-7]|jgi:amino acid transporter|nr:MAG: amino acid permease [Actinobacteria bacterium HGW-Actinobacteria-7]
MPGLKRFVLGHAMHNQEVQHQRLSNPIALAVFSSDALSSTAYATGEILLVLAVAGSAVLKLTIPIAMGIALLLVIVVASYRQTIKAYPMGGGSYRVASDNLGTFAGLTAGASLLVDYVLTVAVSVSAGVAAITSAAPALSSWRVPIALGLMGIVAVANLRGVKESGAVFAVPTYGFVVLIVTLVVTGLYRWLTQGAAAIAIPVSESLVATAPLTMFLVMKAFASGCAAMTGVEAIADGVAVFREPTAKNARTTITWMAGILLFLFMGLSVLAIVAGVQPTEETVISQLARVLFGSGVAYWLVTVFTTAILVVAANTAYADFPRLSSFLAADDFLPHQMRDLGHRAVFSNGILLLTAAAAMLIVIFGGQTSRLIPLYALGVFTSFTLSQAGMVIHHMREREPRWKVAAVINGFGACVTGVVLAVVVYSKFADGAWIVVLLIPTIIAYFLWVRRRYDFVREELRLRPEDLTDLNWQSYNRMHNHVIVLVKNIDRRIIRAIQYAKSLRADRMEALYVDIAGDGASMRARWDEADFGVKLTVIESPYREIVRPIVDYVRAVPRPTDDHVVTVIMPEYAPENIADNILHDQTSLFLKTSLFSTPGVIVTDVPYRTSDGADVTKRAAQPSAPAR